MKSFHYLFFWIKLIFMVPCCCKLPSNHQLQCWLIVFFITLPLNRKASSFITKICLSSIHCYSVPLIGTHTAFWRTQACPSGQARNACFMQDMLLTDVPPHTVPPWGWRSEVSRSSMVLSGTTSCQELRPPELMEKTLLAFKLTGTGTAPQLSSFPAVPSLALPCLGSWSPIAGDYSVTACCSPGLLVGLSKVLSSKGNLSSSPMGDIQAEPPPALGHFPLLLVRRCLARALLCAWEQQKL